MTDDVRKLLGGYATGTLSDEEKQLLFDAALTDDALFTALADEQALKEMLEDGAVRAQLLRATEEPKFTARGALRTWFERPKSKALVATGAVLMIAIGVKSVREVERPSQQVAEVRRPAHSPELPAAAPPAATPPVMDPPAPSEAGKAAAKRRAEVPVQPRPVESKALKEETSQSTANAIVAQAPPPPPPPAMESAKSFRMADEARPAPVARAAAPAAASGLASAPFERAAGTSVTPLRYELLRKEANGEFRPVPVNYEFTAGDSIRVRVTSASDGAVAITAPGVPVVSARTAANVSSDLPATGGIAITPRVTRLVVSFAEGGPGLTVEIPIRHRQ